MTASAEFPAFDGLPRYHGVPDRVGLLSDR